MVLMRAMVVGLAIMMTACASRVAHRWEVHDMSRPQPAVVKPGGVVTIKPPSDAIVLFDGTDLSQWVNRKGEPAQWQVEDGVMVVTKTGDIFTRESFGDCQLHLEFKTPVEADERGQKWGNSGVFLMGLYEVQVLNSYENDTYADGQAAAIYGQHPPLVNVSRKPGQWQSYDIIFRAPRFDERGRLREPAYVTVLHNGVLVQNHVALEGPTRHKQRTSYKAHADKLPLRLQDHSDPVQFRNIWIRPIPGSD